MRLQANMRFVLTAQAWVVVLRQGRPAAQTLGRYSPKRSGLFIDCGVNHLKLYPR